MARSSASGRGRRRVLGTLVLVVALGAIWGGAWGLKEWAPFAHDHAAVTWPRNIEPLAQFVETATQQRFVEPVTVRFIADGAQYDATIADAPPTDDDRQLADTQDAVGRALGMWDGTTSTLDAAAAMDASSPPAQWHRAEHTLYVNASGTDTLGPLVRASIVTQLTAALDEQHHHLLQRRADATTRQQAQALGATANGHAIWVHDMYVDSMSSDDAAQYSAESEERYAPFDGGLDGIAPSFIALRVVSQRLGPPFVSALDAAGHDVLAHALGSGAPQALDQLMLPVSKYLHRDRVEDVHAPAVPKGATLEFRTQAGPFLLYLMVSTGMVANDALTVADGWGSDAYTVYRLGGRVCLDLHVVADSRDDADLIELGLQAWARSRPAEADALIGRKGTNLYVSVCDPGADVNQTGPDQDAIDQFFARSSMIRNEVNDGVQPAVAECTAVTFSSRYSLADLRSGAVTADVSTELDTIRANCADQL